jgi:hypothetical protein
MLCKIAASGTSLLSIRGLSNGQDSVGHAVLCREEAVNVSKLKNTLEAKGVDLVGLIHERIPEEVRAHTLPDVLLFVASL